jgi:hypothetical protein
MRIEAGKYYRFMVYRVAPKPAAPREGWVPAVHPTRRDCKVAHPDCEPVFVRVVEPEGGA